MKQWTATESDLDWEMARGMIEQFLPECEWHEEVVEIERGLPGRLETRADGRRRYWFPRCRVRVRRLADGRELERRYSFVFEWCEGRWQLCELPAVGC